MMLWDTPFILRLARMVATSAGATAPHGALPLAAGIQAQLDMESQIASAETM